jgi:fatty acid desaturase
MLKYLRYLIVTVVVMIHALGMIMGDYWMWMGFIIISLLLVTGDFILGRDLSIPDFKYEGLLRAFLFLSFPVLLFILFLLAWQSGQGNFDLLWFGSAIQSLTGYNMIAARAASDWYDYIGAVLGTGLIIAGYGTTVAHELFHKLHRKSDYIVGRWLMAMSCNADFTIEHISGHHVKVATTEDPATARRGENVFKFFIRSTIHGHLSAWEITKNKLKKQGYSLFSYRNPMLRGYLMSALYLGGFIYAGGWIGAVFFLSQAIYAKFILEVVNYMEHYGLIRVSKTKVEPRHSWNSTHRLSSVVLFDLTRHSSHHEKATLPYWRLKPYPDAPEMPFGYLTNIYVCHIPPLWHKIMTPKLIEWDRSYATEQEKKIAEVHNKKSRISQLMNNH